MIIIRLVVQNISIESALLIAGIVAITSGFVGDVMFDYKTGKIFGTNPKAQLISQTVGGIVGAIVASFTIFIIINHYGPVFSDTLPAVQAKAVFGMLMGSFSPVIFWCSVAVGIGLYLVRFPATMLGIGLYLPFQISLAVFIGGAIRFVVDKFFKKQSENGIVVASGIFGGESITGVVIAFISMMLI